MIFLFSTAAELPYHFQEKRKVAYGIGVFWAADVRDIMGSKSSTQVKVTKPAAKVEPEIVQPSGGVHFFENLH